MRYAVLQRIRRLVLPTRESGRRSVLVHEGVEIARADGEYSVEFD